MRHLSRPLLIAAVVCSFVAASSPILAETKACTAAVPASFNVPLVGQLSDIVFDDACEHVYVSSTSTNHVAVYSLDTLALQTPIQVGSLPAGIDFSPDGATLYVANSGGNNISVVDVSQGTETRKIPVAAGFSNDRPFSIGVASTGIALFTTTFNGSGFGGRMLQYDPATDKVTQRTDFWINGTNTESTFVSASSDRSAIGIVAGDISSGPVFRYDATANTFGKEKDLATFVTFVALDQTGANILVDPGTYVLDATLSLGGTITGSGFGVAVDPSGAVGYRVGVTAVDVLSLAGFSVAGSLDLADTVTSANRFDGFGVGRLAISRDGALLAAITDHGFSIIPTNEESTPSPTPTPKPTPTPTPALNGSRACRREIGKRASGLVNVALAVIDVCHRARDAGKLQGNCNDLGRTDTKGKFAKAIVTANRAIAKKCAPEDPVRAAYADRDPSGVLAAVIPVALAAGGQDLLGVPALVGDKVEIACHSAIAKAMAGDIRETLKLGTACQNAIDKQADTFGILAADCVATPVKSGPKSDAAVGKKCGAKGVAGGDVGSCNPLPSCVRSSATTTAQTLLEEIYGGAAP